MRKISIVASLLSVLALSGCTEEETALELNVRPLLFDGYRFEVGKTLTQMDETEHTAVHTICDETDVTSLPDRPFVFDASYRSFSRFSPEMVSPLTGLTVFHDDEAAYAYCETGHSRYVKQIDPELMPIAYREAAPEPLRPRSARVSADTQQTLLEQFEDDAPYFEFKPFNVPYVALQAPLFTTLSIEVNTQDASTTFSRPYEPSLGLQHVTLSLHIIEMNGFVQPALFESSEVNTSQWPLDPVPDGGVPTLSDTYPLPETLEFGKTYPLWQLSYDVEGEVVEQTVSLRYEPPVTMTQAEVDAATMTADEEVTIGYFHKTPLSGKTELHALDAVQTLTTDGATLKQIVARAEPVKRSGEPSDYPLFTLIEGVTSQTFEVTLHKRSKKTDVFLTTEGKHYKLNSEDSATWLSLAPY